LMAHQALMQGTEAWHLMDGDKIITIRPQGRFKADNGIALVAAAVAGLGIAYLPDWLTDEYVASGALIPVMTRHPPPPAGAYVVRPPGQHPARKVRILTELLIEYCDGSSQPEKATTATMRNDSVSGGVGKRRSGDSVKNRASRDQRS